MSYASEDRQAAQVIRDALAALGLEAWYDESALDGGDAWDQKIRRQIDSCALFVPIPGSFLNSSINRAIGSANRLEFAPNEPAT